MAVITSAPPSAKARAFDAVVPARLVGAVIRSVGLVAVAPRADGSRDTSTGDVADA